MAMDILYIAEMQGHSRIFPWLFVYSWECICCHCYPRVVGKVFHRVRAVLFLYVSPDVSPDTSQHIGNGELQFTTFFLHASFRTDNYLPLL